MICAKVNVFVAGKKNDSVYIERQNRDLGKIIYFPSLCIAVCAPFSRISEGRPRVGTQGTRDPFSRIYFSYFSSNFPANYYCLLVNRTISVILTEKFYLFIFNQRSIF